MLCNLYMFLFSAIDIVTMKNIIAYRTQEANINFMKIFSGGTEQQLSTDADNAQ